MAVNVVKVTFFLCLLLWAAPCHGIHFCFPNNTTCWPSADEISIFKACLTGSLVLPGDEDYVKDTLLMNLQYTRHPALVVMAETEQDVQHSVLFSKKFRIRPSVIVSGHDFIGRSTADGSLMINLSRMQSINIKDKVVYGDYSGPAVTVAVGNRWRWVYEELDKHKPKYIAVGGSSPLVAMGGYTSGGGHSPMVRMFGLAVDNVLDFTIVLPDGRIAKVTQETTEFKDEFGKTYVVMDTDLFWAVRGGGGGVFGVLTSITFKVYKPPSTFVQYTCVYPWKYAKIGFVGDNVLKNYFSNIKKLPREWGGYLLFNGLNFKALHIIDLDLIGDFTFALLYAGHSYQHAMETIQPFLSFHREWTSPTSCKVNNYTSFWDYEQYVNDTVYTNSYITNFLLSNQSLASSDKLTEAFSKHMMPGGSQTLGSYLGCTATLIGGRADDYPDNSASVSPDLRHGQISMSCGTSWDSKQPQTVKDMLMGQVDRLQTEIRNTFDKGVYYNEPPYHLDDWKTAYWKNNYNRLLQVKIKYDPDLMYRCYHCVGYDLT